MEQNARAEFRGLPPRWDRYEPGARVPRHRHADSHIVVVVKGAYDEAGDAGRRRLQPGSVLVQRPFQAHADTIGAGRVELLCLPLRDAADAPEAGTIRCLDDVVRIAETDAVAAADLAVSLLSPASHDVRDWADHLAEDIRDNPSLKLHEWAVRHGLSPATVSRGFWRAYGVTPCGYRADLRALRAWRTIEATPAGLSDVAAEHGFADQAHMTREVKRITGAPPGAWRRRKCLQDSAAREHALMGA